MEITSRDLLTVMHGMGFGALFMLAFSGALVELYRVSTPGPPSNMSLREHALFRLYLGVMVVLAWLTVFSGAYLIYPWYRATPPSGVADLSGFPRALLLSSPRTSEWHNLGMEWKEHVSWLAPIAMTMVAYVALTYGRGIIQHRQLRIAVLTFAVAAFAATGVAGAFGALLNKIAPVRGGNPITLMESER